MLIKLGKGGLKEERTRKLYPELLKRLDDASDEVRLQACAPIAAFFENVDYSSIWKVEVRACSLKPRASCAYMHVHGVRACSLKLRASCAYMHEHGVRACSLKPRASCACMHVHGVRACSLKPRLLCMGKREHVYVHAE